MPEALGSSKEEVLPSHKPHTGQFVDSHVTITPATQNKTSMKLLLPTLWVWVEGKTQFLPSTATLRQALAPAIQPRDMLLVEDTRIS